MMKIPQNLFMEWLQDVYKMDLGELIDALDEMYEARVYGGGGYYVDQMMMATDVCRGGCRDELLEPRYECNGLSIYRSRGVGVSTQYAQSFILGYTLDLVTFLQCTSGASGIFDEC